MSDFKAALDDYISSRTYQTVAIETDKAIQTALRIADRLQSGDVSIDMTKVACELKESSTCNDIFKAMAEQMIKEIANEFR